MITRPYTGRQDGAALVVGLILLLVLTVLGVSGMNTATMEWSMAANDQYAENAFQAAETGIDRALAGGAFTTQNSVTSPLSVLPNGASFTTDMNYIVETAPPPRPGLGFSQGLGGSGFSAYHFEIESTGQAQRNALSEHNQGFYVIGPNGGR
jgi:type IV pilus assembly protein PilX